MMRRMIGRRPVRVVAVVVTALGAACIAAAEPAFADEAIATSKSNAPCPTTGVCQYNGERKEEDDECKWTGNYPADARGTVQCIVSGRWYEYECQSTRRGLDWVLVNRRDCRTYDVGPKPQRLPSGATCR